MPRKMNSSKIGEKSSITLGDFKMPLATSSPTTADETPLSFETIEELREYIDAAKNKLKTSVENFYQERTSELIAARDLLSSGNYEGYPTTKDIKAIQKMYKEYLKGNQENLSNMEPGATLQGNDTKTTNNGYKFDPSISAIQGDKEKKRAKFAAEVDDSVFKKPSEQTKSTMRSKNINLYRTPQSTRSRGYNVAVVTPGPNSQKPISILRRPNPGEMAISMTGSPLLIAHNNIPVHVPQISIPLSDGRVMTVLANDALDPDMSICSDIDTETRERLAVLQELLTKKTRNIRT